MEPSDKDNIFEVDESNVTFKKSSSRSAGCCGRCVRMTLLCFPTILSLLCLVGVVVFGVLYYRMAEDRIASLQNETSSLNGQFSELSAQQNAGQSSGNSSNLVLDRIASFQNEISALLDQVSELSAQLNASQSLIQQLNITIGNDSDLVLVEQKLTQTMTDVKNLDSRVTEDRNRISEEITYGQRVTYVRWGSSSCPSTNGTTLVYGGYAAGNSFMLQGGGSNHLCMPTDPEYTLPSEDGTRGASLIYGVEYESGYLGTANENAPCAVCSVSTRAEIIMIPAKTSCPADWTREYFGFLMSEGTGNYRTMYICVDEGMESVPNTSGHMESSDLWNTEASCISLPCNDDQYNDHQELGCVVCTK